MSDSTTSATSLLNEQLETTIIQPLLATSVVLRSGPRILTPSRGAPIRVPKLTSFADLNEANFADTMADFWAGEGDPIDEDAPGWDEVTLLPNDLRSIK